MNKMKTKDKHEYIKKLQAQSHDLKVKQLVKFQEFLIKNKKLLYSFEEAAEEFLTNNKDK